jgi:DNA-binding beta-propeller fold protein YncE
MMCARVTFGFSIWAISFCSLSEASAQTSQTSQPSERRFGVYRATIANLLDPVGVAVDAKDQIYVVESGKHRVAVYDAKGKFLRAMGGKGEGEGKLLFPTGVCISREGEVFVSDTGNHRICVFSTSGKFKRQWGKYGWSRSDLIAPAGIAVTDKRVYVADGGNDRVQVFDLDGKPLQSIGSFGTDNGKFRRPVSVALDRDGKLFILDRDNSRIQVFDARGEFVSQWGQWGPFPGMVEGPQGLCTHVGQVFIADTLNHRIQVFEPDGKPAYQWGIHAFMPRDGNGKLHYPNSISIAPSGRFAVVSEGFENRCQIFDRTPPGQMPPTSPYILNDPTANSHFGPSGSVSGNLLALTEMEVQQISIHNIATSPPIQIGLIGGFGTKPGQFVRPVGVDIDAKLSSLIVGDAGNRRLQEFRLKQDPPGQLRFIPQMGQLVRCLEFEALKKASPELRERSVIEPTVVRRGSRGRVYVLDSVQGLILVLDQDWKIEEMWSDENNRCLRYPTDLRPRDDIDGRLWRGADNLCVSDAKTPDLIVFFSHRRMILTTKLEKIENPGGIALGKTGEFFVSDEHKARVVCKSVVPQPESGSNANEAWAIGGDGIGAGQFYRPRGIMVDDKGRVFVIDYGNHRCQIFSPDGKFLEVFGATYFIKPALRGEGDETNAQ